MAKSKTFKSDTGVSIYIPNRPDPIRVNAGEPYETADKQELDALAASSEVTEVKSGGKN
jgi:hypothetical protein